jgi:hypothetical protein
MQPIRSSTSSTSEAPGCDGLRRGHQSRNSCPRLRCHPPGTLAAHRAPSGAPASSSSNRPNGRVRSIPGIPVGSAADDRHHDVLARAGAPRLARSRPARAAVRVAGPRPALAETTRMAAGTCPGHAAARSGCTRDRHASLSRTRTPANSAHGSTASSSPLPGARPVGSGNGRCARNDSARRVCRPVIDEHATSLVVDLGPDEGPPKPRPGAA